MRKFSIFYFVFAFLLAGVAFNACSSFDDDCCEEDVILPPDTIKMPPVVLGEKPEPYKVTIQIGAFRDDSYATEFYSKARGDLGNDVKKMLDPLDGLYKITVGVYNSVEEANSDLQSVISRGYRDAFVKTIKP